MATPSGPEKGSAWSPTFHPIIRGRVVRLANENLPLPVHLDGHALDLVRFQLDVAGLLAQTDADAAGTAARLLDAIAANRDVLGFALDFDGNAVLGAAVGNAVALQPIAVWGERLAALAAEQHADLAAAADVIVADEVVGIAMADGDAEVAGVLDDVLLGQAILDAPAEEQADGVPLQLVATDDGSLRAGAGVQAQVGIIVTVTALDGHIVTDLPADAVAVGLAGRHAAGRYPTAILKPDTAGVVAGEVSAVLAVAVQRQVLDHNVGDFLAAQ